MQTDIPGLCKLVNDLHQLLRRNYAGLPPFYLSVFKQDERGYSLDLELLGYRWILVHINFQYRNGFAQRILCLLQDGRHGFTRTAPFCKKINQYGFAGIDDFTKTCHIFYFILQHTIYQIDLLVWKFND